MNQWNVHDTMMTPMFGLVMFLLNILGVLAIMMGKNGNLEAIVFPSEAIQCQEIPNLR